MNGDNKMNSFDKISFEVPLYYVTKISYQYFQDSEKHSVGDPTTSLYSFPGSSRPGKIYLNRTLVKEVLPNSKKLGINSIVVDNLKESVTITITAKILKARYLEGITADNLQTVIEELNASGIIEIDYLGVKAEANVLKCDIKADITVDKPTKIYFSSIKRQAIKNNYLMNNYTRRGYVIKGLAKSNKLRICIYDKGKEMKRDKNIYLLSLFPDGTFKHIIRVEVNLTGFKNIRKYYGYSGSTDIFKLWDILNYPGNICEVVIDELFRNPEMYSFPTISISSPDSFMENVKLHGYLKLLENYDNNYTLLMNDIRTNFPKLQSHQLTKFAEVSRYTPVKKNYVPDELFIEILNKLKWPKKAA